ncbi:MAG: PKD-like domain-containing protein [Bacteroidales bacterium]|nr:PKD-like domain-containing protein [Bacteroidales bacterium]
MIFFFVHPGFLWSEGTKELEPLPGGETNPTKLHLSSYTQPTNVNYNNFALYIAGANERLQITIGNTTPGSGEVIYFGFKPQPTGTIPAPTDPQISCRIKNAAGTVVWGPQLLAWQTGNPGFIDTYNQAVIGPNVLPGGATGYTALSFTPATTGDYYIEFSFPGTNVSRTFDYFDITVADASGGKIPGRVWSKAWQFTTDGATNVSKAILYPYTDDGITTSIDFNGISPYRFAVSCNATGCNNTGNIATDRKSVTGKYTYPQFRIFLNEPDHTISYFPVGELGVLQSATVLDISCDGSTLIQIMVNKAGIVKITIVLPLPYINRILDNIPVSASPTPNLITWNGLDGAGIPVANGTPFSISVEYINGLTNLPLYDAEYMNYTSAPPGPITYPTWTGYIIKLVSPQTTPPDPPVEILKYWDDTQISICDVNCVSTVTCSPPTGGKKEIGGKNDVAGCNAPTGCHPWTYCIGNENTVNTWWYALSQNSIEINALVEKRIPDTPGPILGPVDFCTGTDQTFSVNPVPNATSYNWSYPPGVTPVGTPPFTNSSITLHFPVSVLGTQTITVTGFNSDCGNGPSNSLNVNVKPIPDAVTNPDPPLFLCNNSTAIIILSSSVAGTVGNTSFNWVANAVNPGNVTPPDPFGSTTTQISQAFFNSGTVPEDINVEIIPVSNGCTGAAINFLITVYPTAFVTPIPDQVYCNGFDAPETEITSPFGTGTTYTWTNSNPAIGLDPSGSGNIPGFTATNTDIVPVTATINIIPTANQCVGTPFSYIITVNPTPEVNPIADQVYCNGVTVASTPVSSPVGAGTTFSWTNSNPAIGLAASGTGDISAFTAINAGTTPISATISIIPTANNCMGPESSFFIMVNPTPIVDPIADQIFCNGIAAAATAVSSPVGAGTTFSWTNSNPAIGLAASGTGNIPPFTATNTGISPISATISIIPTANLCVGTQSTYLITVNPTPTVNPITNQVYCNGVGTSATLVTSPVGAGTTFSWTNSNTTIGLGASGTGNISAFTATNTGIVPVNATISITPTANNCVGTGSSFQIIVNPTPTVNPIADQIYCDGFNATETILTSPVGAGTTFSWTNSNTAIGLAAAGTGNIAAFTTTNTGIVPISATISIIPTANSCPGQVSSFLITVNPKPNVICDPSQTICSGDLTLSTLLSSNVLAGVNYTWTAVATPLSLYGFSASGSSTTAIPGELIFNPEIIQGTVTYTITAHFGSCIGTTNTHIVQVNPSPTVTPAPISQSVCSSYESSQQINFTANVSPTTYIWTVENVSGLNPGYLTDGTTDNIPAQMFTLSGSLQGSIKYKITPSSQIGMSCPGAPNYATIFVNPLPAPVISGPVTACELGLEITYATPSIPGHSYLWTITGGTITSPVGGNQINVQWGSFAASPGTLTVTETIDATGCLATNSINVILLQRPVPALTGPQTVCQGSMLNTYVTDPSMSQYTWQIFGGNITSGGTSGSNTAVVTWTTPGINNWIEVNYVNSSGCPGFPANHYSVTVNPLPNTTITSPPAPICQDYPTLYSYSVPPDAGSNFVWTLMPNSGWIITPGAASSSFQIKWTSPGIYTISVQGINTTTGCTSTSVPPVVANIFPKPNVSFQACFDIVTTKNAKPFLLKGGSPLGTGGKYYINGAIVAGGVLDPSGLSVANHNVSYTYTDVNGCQASDVKTITVLPSNAAYSCANNIFTDPRNPDPATNKYPTTPVTANGKTTCWMLKNLNWGVTIASSQPQTDNCSPERYCASNDNTCAAHGSLFQWDELMQYGSTPGWTKGVCPPGWHVPTFNEWQDLIDGLAGTSPGAGLAGYYLRYPTGFNALLNGLFYQNSSWAFSSGAPIGTMFWTSTLVGVKPIAHGINTINPSVSMYESSKANAFPVRCVKD